MSAHLWLIKSAREIGGLALSWTMIAALTAPPAWANEAAAPVASAQSAQSAAPTSHAASLEQQYELWNEIQLLDSQLDPLAKKIDDGSATDGDKQRYDQLMKQAAPLRQREEEVRNETGDQELLGVNRNADGSVQPATISSDKAPSDGDQLTAEQQNEMYAKSAQEAAQNGHSGGAITGIAKNFSSQYVTFSVATGFIAMSQLMLADPRNPNALEQWEKQTFNLMGAAGFGAFMLANHSVIKTYQLMRRKAVPSSLMNYVGMSAGMIAQTVFSDFARDPDVWKCIRPYYDVKAKPIAGICEKARNEWLSSGKILQYAPAVIGMIGSTAIAESGQAGIRKVLSKVPRESKGYLKLVARGMKLVPKSEAVRAAGRFAGRQVLGLGNFVIFLVVDSYWVEEPVNQIWQNIRENHVDLKAWADTHLGFHSEFLWPKTYQPISDALDVEATTPSTAHQYLMELYRRLQANNWKRPASVETCVPADIAKAEKTAKPDDLKGLWFWQRWGIERSRQKSETQLQCEVFARPVDLLGRYGDTNKEWRGVLLSPFSSSQANWVDMVAQFSESYAASYSLAHYMAQQKYNQVTKGQAQAPDLSRENLAKVTNAPLPPEDDNADRPETHQSWFLDGTWIPTPELVDYIAAGSACGPDPVLTPGNDEGSMVNRAYHGVYSYFARKIESPNFISTPYGSSLRFVPPKLTNQSRAICQNAPTSLYSTVNYITGNYLPKLGGDQTAKNPFDGTFTDEKGTKYTNLAQYTYDNLDPELYKATSVGFLFANWWQDHFIKVIKPVWARYDVEYQRFLKEYYVPALFDRSFRDGCRDVMPSATPAAKGAVALQPATTVVNGKEQVCADQSNAYRVSNGVFLAIETEMRNYLRGWYSLYAASLGKDPGSKKATFVQISNALLSATHVLDANTLQSAAFADQAQTSLDNLKQLNAMVTEALQNDKSADGQFRRDMNAKFNDLIMKLLTEEGQDAQTYRTLQFGATRTAASVGTSKVVGRPASGGADQNVDSEAYVSSNLAIPK